MNPGRWFLPHSPDVLGLLGEQTAITVDGMRALHAWSLGDAEARQRLRDLEHRADERKRALREALSEAFSTPLEPEDIFELSRGLDTVLTSAKNTAREAEVMESEPDSSIAAMAADLLAGTEDLADAFAALGRGDHAAATAAADAAAKKQSGVEHTYRSAMSALIGVSDLREVAAKRELYRRLARMGDDLRQVAERVWYSVLKQS